MPTVQVETATSKNHQRLLAVRGEAGGLSTIPLGRFALVGPGDQLRIRNGGAARFVELKGLNGNEWVPVEPCYRSDGTLEIGKQRFCLAFSEIESADQMKGYERLESFHYRGRLLDEDPNSGAAEAKGIGGRKAVLIASVTVGDRARIVGYIELQMPLMMCKPRHDLFSLPFQHNARDISWSKWLGDGQQHINLIVRIARVVVDPEFRGLGISHELVKQAKLFSASRWTVGGQRPLFLEISAEMLRYMDFVSRAGLAFIGNTEGNLDRISKDLSSIERGASGKSQIMSLQKKYHAAFSAYCEATKRSFDEARAVLVELLKSENPREAMPSDEWLAFRPILRFPIPYHIAGLDADSQAYVDSCLAALRSRVECQPHKKTPQKRKNASKQDSPVLQCKSLEIWVDHKLNLTPYVRLTMDSFGIDSSRVRTRLVGPVDIDLVAGNVALITGSSGAGKSVLLDSLSGKRLPGGLMIRGAQPTNNAIVAKLQPLPEKTPLLQYFGRRYGAEKAFDTLCRVGLSEAMIFIKPFALLSMGQRYRAMLADLLLRDANVWLIDEFCSNVDPITAAVIAAQIRRLSRQLGVIVVAAAANTTHFIDSLGADVVYVVRTGGEVLKLGIKEFKNGFYEKGL